MTKETITFDAKSGGVKTSLDARDTSNNHIHIETGKMPAVTCDGVPQTIDQKKLLELQQGITDAIGGLYNGLPKESTVLKTKEDFWHFTHEANVKTATTDTFDILGNVGKQFAAVIDRAHVKDDSSAVYENGKLTTKLHVSGDVTLKENLPSPLSAMCKVGKDIGLLKH